MAKGILNELITAGREIEFGCKGKQYSFTYCNDNRKNIFRFVRFVKNTGCMQCSRTLEFNL